MPWGPVGRGIIFVKGLAKEDIQIKPHDNATVGEPDRDSYCFQLCRSNVEK